MEATSRRGYLVKRRDGLIQDVLDLDAHIRDVMKAFMQLLSKATAQKVPEPTRDATGQLLPLRLLLQYPNDGI
jgi:hypothetical protein